MFLWRTCLAKKTQIIKYIILFTFLFCYILHAQETTTVQQQEYTASRGDVVNVTVWERESLSGTVKVDPNGNITLPEPLGVLSVIGLTAEQIKKQLEKRLREYIKEPTVFVSITPTYGFVVHVLGEVQKSSFFEVTEGTRLQEAITMAGDFTPLADEEHIRVIRKERQNNQQEVEERIINFKKFVENTDLEANPVLQPNDVVIVPRLPKEQRIKPISVIGAVTKPGTFILKEEELPIFLTDALALSGGPTDKAILKSLSILTISNGESSWEEIDFEKFLSGEAPNANPKVVPGQVVYVPKEPKEFMVNVMGQVKSPGTYPVTEEFRLFDAIYQAKGFVDEASIDKVTIINPRRKPMKLELDIREYIITGSQKYNPLLMKGDTVFVPMPQGIKKIPSIQTTFFESMRITIMGEIRKPDVYQVTFDASMLDLLKLAGGPTSDADLERVMIIREEAVKSEEQDRLSFDLKKVLEEGKFQLLPSLQPGDTIFVPRMKKETLWETIVSTARDISAILTVFWIIERTASQ